MKTSEISPVQVELFIRMLDKALGVFGYKIVPLDDLEPEPEEPPKPPPKKKAPPLKSVAKFLNKR